MKHKLNLSTIATALINDKWLLDGKTHANLRKMVEKAMNEPLPPYIGEDKEFQLTGPVAADQGNMLAIISVNGILMKGASPDEEELLGLVNTDFIGDAIDDALADPSVTAIVLSFASPGGNTVGIEELGRKIRAADAVKPVYGWTERCCSSAAYWLCSQCRTIGMTPSSIIGNVGVYSLIEDHSAAMAQEGVEIQAIASGKYKLMGHPFRKLTEEEIKLIQDDVTKQHQKFKAVIQSVRKIDDANLEGLSYEGEEALALNFVDVVVDDLQAYLTTTQSIDTHMKSYIKTPQATAAPITVVATATQAEMPGVPGVTKTKTEVASEPEKVAPKQVTCPHCQQAFDPSTPHTEPDGDEKAEAVEPKKDEPVEPKKEEAPATNEPDGDEPKVEPKKDEPVEPKKDEKKKAVMPNMSDWKLALGQPESTSNPLYAAAVELVKNFSQLK